MDIKIIFPGRFQPFSKNHFVTYQHLLKKFKDVYVATSDKVDDISSPFTFEEKKMIIEQFGVPSNRIIMERSPYRPNFVNNFDISETALIIALGEKDNDRIQYFKKDGSPGYYKPFKDGIQLESLDKTGYIYICPPADVYHNGNEISGTYSRNLLKIASPEEFLEYMGWFNEKIYKMIRKKLKSEILEAALIGNLDDSHKESILGILSKNFPHKRKLKEAIIDTFPSLGIDRINLPQINDIQLFLSWLTTSEINYHTELVPVSEIQFTQTELNTDKIKNIIKDYGGVDEFIISNDMYALDGQHRIAALKIDNEDMLIRVYKINQNIAELINTASHCPFVTFKNINE